MTTSVEPEDNPEAEALLRRGRRAVGEPMSARQRHAEWLVGGAFLLVAVPLGLLLPGTTAWNSVTALALVLAYAGATRVRFELGGGQTDPSLLVLVPMLFGVPSGWVPLLVAAGFLLGRLPDLLSGKVHRDRWVLALGNSWHAVGPAAVLAIAGPGTPHLTALPLYAAAFVAQGGGDVAAGLVREWFARGVRPRLQIRLLGQVYALDAVLAPVGLLIAIADATEPLSLLLAAPLAVVLAAFSRERQRRLDNALALGDERHKVLEAELRAERARGDVFAALSHGLQTPLASVTGLARTLRDHGEALDASRRAQVAEGLHRDAVRLRHLVRQALDYEAVRGGASLRARLQPVDLGAVAREVATHFDGVDVRGTGGGTADPTRVHQVLTALIANAVEHAPAPVVVEVADGVLHVVDAGPGVPVDARATLFAEHRPHRDESAGTGIGLLVARAAASSMGGELTVSFPPEGGSRFSLALPAGAEAQPYAMNSSSDPSGSRK